MFNPYEIRTMALFASGVGKIIWNVSLFTVLSEPKSNTATDGSPATESLYISAPRAVNDALAQVELLNEINAVGMLAELLPDVGDVEITKVLPPAV
jgi:hypothetical protein